MARKIIAAIIIVLVLLAAVWVYLVTQTPVGAAIGDTAKALGVGNFFGK